MTKHEKQGDHLEPDHGKGPTKIEGASSEAHEGMPDLLKDRQKMADYLKGGGRSGISNDFGKLKIDDPIGTDNANAGDKTVSLKEHPRDLPPDALKKAEKELAEALRSGDPDKILEALRHERDLANPGLSPAQKEELLQMSHRASEQLVKLAVDNHDEDAMRHAMLTQIQLDYNLDYSSSEHIRKVLVEDLYHIAKLIRAMHKNEPDDPAGGDAWYFEQTAWEIAHHREKD